MPPIDSIKYGILKCRDLVELYFLGRMVTTVKEAYFLINSNTPVQVIGQDPRRISYELWLSVPDGGTYWSVSMGSNFDAVANAPAPVFSSPPAQWLIKRSFFDDLDAVCLPVFACTISSFTGPVITTREVILTPAPVDEIP